jgi:hypothetical protein
MATLVESTPASRPIMMWPLLVLGALHAAPAADTLASIDLYGLRTVPEAAVLAAIGLRAGEAVPESADSIRARVARLPGVAEVDVARVCCAEDGGTMLYVGIRETGTAPAVFRAAPSGDARLPEEIVAAGAAFESALMSAVRRGAAEEDDSLGYSLARDSAMRTVQERFIAFAARDAEVLRTVLHSSADADHRALATQIIAYHADRPAVARDLLHAVGDPADEVRNNAVRALAILAQWANAHQEAEIRIPAEPFIGFLNSVSWTDRNKGVFVLMALTDGRDPALLAQLRARALPSLVEMARWTNPGHAMGAYLVLARMAGVDDGAAFQAWQAGDRESVIVRAMEGDGRAEILE